ncbi:MAG: hypothetical protein ABI988_10785, partial [Nitrospirota bacterium]
ACRTISKIGPDFLLILYICFYFLVLRDASMQAQARYDGETKKDKFGDRNRNIDTLLYRKLARILKPIRSQHHPPPYAEGRFAEDGEYEAWLGRFDE